VSFVSRLAVALAALLIWPGVASALRSVKVGDFPSPTFVSAPPGDPDRLFVTERGGRIEVLRDGTRGLFLDIRGVVDSTGEKGLFSMAFAPDYAKSGRFYVYYAAPVREIRSATC
jgi:glucose/arabinose dehydrogenase